MEENNNYPTTELGEKYLPIGTVVILKEAQKRLIIIGYDVRNAANESRDYCGCFFPEGMKDSNSLMVFNHDKIDKVFHMGLYDDESKDFFEKLSVVVKKRDERIVPEKPNDPYTPTNNENNSNTPNNVSGTITNNPIVDPAVNQAPVVDEPQTIQEPPTVEPELEEPVIDESELEEPTLIDDEQTNNGQPNDSSNM